MLLVNGKIYTFDGRLPITNGLLIRGQHVTAAADGEILRQALGREEVIDLGGKTVLPGLVDSHVHLSYFARSLAKVKCETHTREECLRRVRDRAAQTPAGRWVLGHGWNQNVWAGGFGDPADLEAVVPDHPVYLTDKSLHGGWANQAALKLAGVGPESRDPEGGRITRGADGRPNGFVFEAATLLLEKVIPAPGVKELAPAIRNAQEELWKVGLTGVHDFDGSDCYQALQILDSEGDLLLRVVKSIPLGKLPSALDTGLRSGAGSEFLKVGAVKIFSDGGLGVQTAAMLEPYENSSSLGMLSMEEDELFENVTAASQGGLDAAIHAIGDRANRTVLNALERVREYEGRHALPHRRHRIEHVQLIHPDDAGRLAELWITASMQPVHATSDIAAADVHWGARSKTAYAWNLLAGRGTRLAFGSDAPVESPNPFWGIHAAVTRRQQNGYPGPQGWYPEQRIDINLALQAFTTGAAHATGLESRQGRLWTGCYADLIVLNGDPFETPPDELYHLKPTATMVAGKWVWEERI